MVEAQACCITSGTYSRAETPEQSQSLDEGALLAWWDEDVLRAARVLVARAGLRAIHATAEDVAQEVRLRLLLAIRTRRARPEGYLRRTIAHAARNAVRSERRLKFVPLEEAGLNSKAITLPNRDVLVRKWVKRLPRPLRRTFYYLYVEGRSQRQAAAAMGISQPRVAQFHRKLIELGRSELARYNR